MIRAGLDSRAESLRGLRCVSGEDRDRVAPPAADGGKSVAGRVTPPAADGGRYTLNGIILAYDKSPDGRVVEGYLT